MKPSIPLFAALLLSSFSINATPCYSYGDDEDPEEIEITALNNGEDPNSTNTVYVTAYKTQTEIVVTIQNYYGNAGAFVRGMGCSISSEQVNIVGTGMIIINIASLPCGNYSLIVSADQLYQGAFSK